MKKDILNRLLESLKVAVLTFIENYLKPQDTKRETPDENFKGFATLGIIVGHSKASPGASFALGANEYQFNKEIAEIAKRYADSVYGKVLKTHVIFRDGIGRSGAYKKAEKLKCDCVIELHFNAFNKLVSGSETLTTTDVGDQAYGQAIQNMIVKVFKRRGKSRGLKPISRNARGGANVYAFPSGYNCLPEPFFGDNKAEAALANSKKVEYARGLIDATVGFSKYHLGLIS